VANAQLCLSPTSIDRYRVCPKRFYFQDVAGRKFDDVKSYEQLLGEAVHKALEQLLRLPAAARKESVSRVVDQAALRFAAANRLSTDAHERLRDTALQLGEPYVSQLGTKTNTLRTEQAFQLRLSNGTVIKTRVDRIDANDRGLLEVVDYKTGRHQIDERDLAYETAPIVQLHAVGKASEIPVEEVTWVYLQSGESISWCPEAEDVEAATDRLIRVLRNMHAERSYEPNPGRHCSSCPFKTICPAFGDVGANEAFAERA